MATRPPHGRHLRQTRHHPKRRTTDRLRQAPMDIRHPLLLPSPITKDHPGSHSTVSHHQQRHTGPTVRCIHHRTTGAPAHLQQPTSGSTPAILKCCFSHVHPGPHHHAQQPTESNKPYNSYRDKFPNSNTSVCRFQLPPHCIPH